MNFLSLLPLLIAIAKNQDPITTLQDIDTLGGLANQIKTQGVAVLDGLTVESLRADVQAIQREATLVGKLLADPKQAARALALLKQLLGGSA